MLGDPINTISLSNKNVTCVKLLRNFFKVWEDMGFKEIIN